MKNLAGKVAVVTGAASGIGLALSEMFIAEGMKVVLADIDEIRLADVGAKFVADGADVATFVCDTSSERAVAALADVHVGALWRGARALQQRRHHGHG
jgi:NAD(P)-dependent dehydrogenase (short-subunit alcohol dehydrogenase family)